MKLQLISRGSLLSASSDAKALAAQHQAQLLLALQAYFGKKTSFARAFSGDEPCTVQRYEVVEEQAPNAVLYDFWEVNRDSGSLFFSGREERVGIEMLQFGFEITSGAKDDAALLELVLSLSEAERLAEPDEPLRYEEGQREGRVIQRLAGFNQESAVPRNKRAWSKLLQGPNIYMTEAFAERYGEHWGREPWLMVVRYGELSEAFIRRHIAQLTMAEVCFYQPLSEAFLREFADEVHWENVSMRQRLSEGFIREFADRVDWSEIVREQSVSDAFIEEFADKIDFEAIDCTRRTEAFLRKHADRLRWSGGGSVSWWVDMPDAFLRDFSERVSWMDVTMYRAHSDASLEEFAEKIEWRLLGHNEHLTDEQIRRYKDKLDWSTLIIWRHRRLSDEMIREHASYLNEIMWRVLVEKRRVSPAYAAEIKAKILRDAKKARVKK